jgi:hypothetical protein
MNVGYARTSTTDQAAGLAAQERDLKAAGAERVFAEQVSSMAQRTKLADCLSFLRDGDVLTVTKPDRLARSTAELLAIEADLSRRGIGLVILSMGGERLDCLNAASAALTAAMRWGTAGSAFGIKMVANVDFSSTSLNSGKSLPPIALRPFDGAIGSVMPRAISAQLAARDRLSYSRMPLDGG